MCVHTAGCRAASYKQWMMRIGKKNKGNLLYMYTYINARTYYELQTKDAFYTGSWKLLDCVQRC